MSPFSQRFHPTLPATLITALLCLLPASMFAAEENYENEPINYSKTAPEDAVTRLQHRLAAADIQLPGDEKEILRLLLVELDVPILSQLLVFSRTSLQLDRISPTNPRAIYYSDTCYVGWVPGGLIEITAIDPQLGPTFYAVDPRNPGRRNGLKFQRDSDCLRCHGGHFIRGVPGVLARSVFPDATGEPIFKFGSTLVDYRTPFEERWGGWYVTGQHGRAQHRGNIIATEADNQIIFPTAEGANVTDLSPYFGTDRYLAPTSDIVSFLVFEHQIAVQNAITKASIEARRMLHYQAGLQEAFKEPVTEEPAYDSVKSVFASVTREVVDALLSKDEATLPFGIKGIPEFGRDYAGESVKSRDGKSLRELTVRRQLYRYRCSPLIYTPMFQAMPAPLKRQIYETLKAALDSDTEDERYDYIGEDERTAIRTILAETLPEFRSILEQT
jgi:hypothetical protein